MITCTDKQPAIVCDNCLAVDIFYSAQEQEKDILQTPYCKECGGERYICNVSLVNVHNGYLDGE